MLFALGLGGILAVFLMEALRTEPPTVPTVPSASINATNATNATMAMSTEPVPHELPVAEPVREPVQEYLIQDGDTLSTIFDRHQIPQTTLFQIMEADEQILALDIIRPGNKLTFSFNEDWSLGQMELYVHPARQIVYRRVDADNLEFEERVHPGTWVQQTISGDIRGSFFLSAQRAGLSETEVANITDLLKTRVNFRRDMRLGDTFQVVRTQQFVGEEFSGQSQILGVRILCGKRVFDAFLFSDGKYYDSEGNSLIRAFTRYPFKGKHRLTSAFNPRRRHPVTGRVSPHNGADFGMPTGTSIYAPGDGVVTRTMKHRYAGKYVEIRHNDRYSTRYLHLSNILVRRGQHVKRGDRIAMSGNTGRSTGPHLHYEFHIKGRPVDPLTAPIPLLASIPKKQREVFKSQVAELVALMDQAQAENAVKLSEAAIR
jgi:murein DD-endopeptidase